MKKGDLQGFGILALIAMFLFGLFVVAPKLAGQKVSYVPVVREGSALAVVADKIATDHVAFKVTALKPSFVTINIYMGGAAGSPLGSSSLIAPGADVEAVAVPSAGVLGPETIYIALLMEDDGDGIYEPGVDLPVKSGGETVKIEFTTP